MGRGTQPANGAALGEDAPVSGAFLATQHLIFSYRAGCEILGIEMLQHVVAQHLFWFVTEHLLHRRTEISEPALSIGGKNDLRHVLYQLAVLDLGLTQRLGRLLLAALGKQDSRAGADQ